jgi:hypothetical protein
MTRVDYDSDQSRPPLDADPRLKRTMMRDPDRCASLGEYAQATGMEVGEVAEALGRYFDEGSMALEVSGDEVFIHTAPTGRLPGSHTLNIPPNLWEQLRTRLDVSDAHALWKIMRDLQRVGWSVEHHAPRIVAALGPVHEKPYLGVMTGHVIVPALLFPSPTTLGTRFGLLEQYEHAGATAVALVCEERDLDKMITSTRRWILDRHLLPEMHVLILEAPQYNPVLLSPADGAVSPVAVSRDTLGNYFW